MKTLRNTCALALLMNASPASAVMIPTYAASNEINVRIIPSASFDVPEGRFTVPWFAEVYGEVDTEAMTWTVTWLSVTPPEQPVTFSHGPHVFTTTIDPPGFEPPYEVTTTSFYDIRLDWTFENLSLFGPVVLPIHPTRLDAGVAFAPFELGIGTGILTGSEPTLQNTDDLFGGIGASLRCTQEPIGCESSIGLSTDGAGAYPYVIGAANVLGGSILANARSISAPSMQALVPEPSVLGMLGLAMAALYARGRVASSVHPT